MMSDLQKNSALSSSHSATAAPCSSSSNGGFDNSISLNGSSNTCFSRSSSSGASSTYPWGTWEDLLLASAVLRHGTDNWTTVSCELQTRAFLVPPSLFSAEACKVRFWILNGRFSSCSSGTLRDGKIPWFEEVRKLRVAQLKRELEHYDGSIGLLEKKLNRLRAEKARSEAVVSRDALERDNPSSVASQVCSAGDQKPAERSVRTPLGSLLDSEFVQSFCADTSTDIKGGTEVQETIPVSDGKESLIITNPDQKFSSDGLIFDESFKKTDCKIHSGRFPDQSHESTDHILQSGSILDQKPLYLDKFDRLSTLKGDHKPHILQDCTCSIVEDKNSSVKIEDIEPESIVKAGGLSVSIGDQNSVAISFQNDGASVLVEEKKVHDSSIKELKDEGLAVEDGQRFCSRPVLDRLVDNDVACTTGELGDRADLSCGPPGFDCFVNGPGCAKSFECINVLPTVASKLADNVNKEDYTVEDSLVSASAMDLLRIAYADGTPVSTPEDVEMQPDEPGKTEELEHSENADCSFPLPIQESVISDPDLFCCNVVEVPSHCDFEELQRKKQNSSLGIEMSLTEASRSLGGVTPVQMELFNPASASGPEHSGEQEDCQAACMAEVSTTLSKVPISILGLETKADTGQPQDVGGFLFCSDRTSSSILEPDKKSLKNEERDPTLGKLAQEGRMLHEIQDLSQMAGSDSVPCFDSFGKERSDNTKAGPCMEMDKLKNEESPEMVLHEDSFQKFENVTMPKEVSLPTQIENTAIGANKSGSHIVIFSEHPALSLSDPQEGSQVRTCGLQSVGEVKKDFSSSAIFHENGTVEFARVMSHGCDPNIVHGSTQFNGQLVNNMPCCSDGRKSVMEPLFESTKKLQEFKPDCAIPDSSLRSGKGTLKASRSTVERIISEVKADSKTLNKQAKIEERSKQLEGYKSCSDVGSSSPAFNGKNNIDIDALEEDGLLVDLMKLKDTDLTTLRKRKHLSRGGNSLEKHKDYNLSNSGLGEFSLDKHPKLSRFQEGDGNKTSLSATQNKNPSKLEACSRDNSEQAAMSTIVPLLDSCRKVGSKESGVEVFSTRRSRLKLRRLESQREEPDKTKRQIVCSVQKVEAVKAADEEVSDLEVSGVLSMVNNAKMGADDRLLPDLLVLLECLRNISGHRFAPLFKIRPEIQSDARYRGLVKRHMDLNTVRTNLEEGTYSESLEFFRDMMLIFSNALVFYSRDSQEYGAARILRENLKKEMDRFLREESPHRSFATTQAVKYSESKVLKNVNISCSVTTCDDKRQMSVKSSCDPTICERGLHGEDVASEPTLGTRIAAQDFGPGSSTYVEELDFKEKERGDLASSRAFNKTKMARTKAHGVELDRLNIQQLGREKHLRSLENAVPNISSKREPVTSSQVLRKAHQASSRTSREYVPRKDSSDKSRSSKYRFERLDSSSQGRQEPRENSGGGRSSRSAQQSKQSHSRGIQSYCQPQKRART